MVATTTDSDGGSTLSAASSDINSTDSETHSSKKRRIQKKTRSVAVEDNTEQQIMQKALAIMDQRNDDLDIFGQLIAAELRRMSDPIARNLIKKEMMIILMNVSTGTTVYLQNGGTIVTESILQTIPNDG